jgi:hypothetical protein
MDWNLESLLELGLRIAALAQLLIAVINLSLVRLMNWRADLERLPLLIREVFGVHVIFITITVAIFAALTWRFAAEIATGEVPLASWLAGAIGIFWGTRSMMQWTHYSRSHWRGDRTRTALHWLLFVGYGALGALYLGAAFLPR